MYQVKFIQTKLLRMFNQAYNEKVKESLVFFLTAIVDECYETKGGVIAESLLNNISRFPSNPHCSEKQAWSVAETAYEHNIYLF